MKLSIGSLYCEPGIHFEISHKVDNFIQEKLIEKIMVPYELDKAEPDIFLGLDITTNSKTTDVQAKGPDFDSENGFINWALWLPYQDIVQASDPLIPYLKYFFEAAIVVFQNYGVKEYDVRSVQKIVESEVINNPNYEFWEEYIPPPDLSFLNGS